ncbi:MAG: FtsQ-type POTRA domain-containing protein [Clostridia bacterium]|nr:FtsQ-type POTRA domain-containing protein [Clostridia bacterium]
MKHKLLIVVSTALVFLLTVVLALVWLLKIRYVEVNVVAESGYEQALYEEIVDVLEKDYVGKSYAFVRESDIENQICANPYVKVKEIKKVFPDRIIVSVERRKEQFAIVYNGEYFITDKEYFLLKKTADEGELKSDVVKITLHDIELDEKSLVEGKTIGYENNVLVGSTTEIFSRLKNGLNLVDSIEIIGERNWIRFYTKTGVCIEFSFTPVGGAETVDKEFAQTIVLKTEEVQTFYNGLNESQKSSGYVIVLTKDSGEISVSYETEKAN